MRYIFLIGLMGSGKSYWGRLLARQLHFTFVDTDEWMAQQTGHSIASLFDQYGEACFRQLEADWLRNSLPHSDAVISTGGGMPCFHQNIDLMLEKGVVVWLAPDLTIMAERIWRYKEKRPLIAQCESPEAVVNILQRLLRERKECYTKADLVEKEEKIDISAWVRRMETVGKFALP